MKNYFFIFAIFISLGTIAQFDYVDQRELYVKYGITEVNAFFHDSALVEHDELWKIDGKGRIVYNELPPDKDDLGYFAEIWNYQNDRLVSNESISLWDTEVDKPDTSFSRYFYDASGKLLQEQHYKNRCTDTLTTEYQYSEDLIVKVKFFNKEQEWWYTSDTIEYYDSKIKRKESTLWFYYGLFELKKESHYDSLGKIQAVIEYFVKHNCFNPDRVSSFFYEDGRLIRIKEVNLEKPFSKDVYDSEILYYYDERGLIIKRSRVRSGMVQNFDTFEYK